MPRYLDKERVESGISLYCILRRGGMTDEEAWARVAISYPPPARSSPLDLTFSQIWQRITRRNP